MIKTGKRLEKLKERLEKLKKRVTKNRDELRTKLRLIKPEDRVNQKKVRNALIVTVIGSLAIIAFYVITGVPAILWKIYYSSQWGSCIGFLIFFVPFLILGLIIDRILRRSLTKTLST